MKINPDKSPIAGFGDLLDATNFESSLPSAATMRAAYGDPSAAVAIGEEVLGRKLVETSVRAFRYVGASVGVEVGIPIGMLQNFDDSLSVAGADEAVTHWVKFAISTGQKAIIDLAVNAMGAIPIVGWIAKAAQALIDGIMAAAAAKRTYPPLLEYNETIDEDHARDRLIALKTNLDWTSTWMPQYLPTKASDWEAVKQETSYLFRCRGAVEVGTNQGAIPGGTLGSRGVQSRNCWSWLETGIGNFTDPDKADRIYIENQRDITECILDVWDTTPSVARVCLSAWQQMTAKQTATVWNCDTRDIVRAWTDYCESAIEYSRINTGGSVVGDPYRWLALKNLARAMFVRHWSQDQGEIDPISRQPVSPARQPRLDQVANNYIKNLRERQYAAVKTKLVAYAQLEQGAFLDPTLRRAMTRERAELLNGGIRWTIDPDDIVDLEYRKVFIESMVGAQPPQRTPPDDRGDPNSIPNASPFLTPDFAGNTSGAGGGLAILALLLGLFLL